MIIGINALNQGRPLGICANIAAKGWQSVRASASYDEKPWAPIPASDLVPLVQEIRDTGMVPFMTVRDEAAVHRMPADARPYIEMGNEPDLENRFGWPTFSKYDEPMWKVIRACERFAFECGVGVVSNPHKRGLAYLERVFGKNNSRGIPAWVDCNIHWYWHPTGQVTASLDERDENGRTRLEQMAKLRAIIGPDRKINVTEDGGFDGHGLTEEQIAARYAFQRAFWEEHCVQHWIVYQINSGGPPGSTDDFGFQQDGVWKLRADAALRQGVFA